MWNQKRGNIMESKTLKTIQRCMKIGKIISTIVYVFCIIGTIGCLVGIACLYFFPQDQVIQLGPVTVHGLVGYNKNALSLSSCYTAMMIGAILCLFEFGIARSAKKYFKNELAAGTPFTFEGAKELMKLGIKVIVLPIVAVIVADVVYQVMNYYFTDIMDMHIDDFVSVGTGLMLMFLSLICKYGAEVGEKKEKFE